jgi:peptide/nickel transport system substrate-binding protein
VVIAFAKPEASAPSLVADDAGRIVGGKAIANPRLLQTTADGSAPYTLSAQVAQLDPTTVSFVKSKDSVVWFPGAEYGFSLFDELGKISRVFASVHVCQALALAVNREAIAGLHTGAVTTASYFALGTPAWTRPKRTTRRRPSSS